jgi:L-fuculose-phosphate aldolase
MRLPAREIARARREVLSASRQMSRLGLVASVWGNVSARVDAAALAVVTPSGVEYERLDEAMLDVVDVATGRVVRGSLRPTTELPLHLAIYRARRDVGGIVHTHSPWATAHAAAGRDLPPIVEDLAQVVGGPVVCAAYAPPGTEDLAGRVVEALGDRGAALMASHGVVGVGPTVAEALRVCEVVEKGARIHAIACALGDPGVLADGDVARLRRAYLTSYGQPR